MVKPASTLGLLFIFAIGSVEAQWLKQRDRTIPRTADGNPNLAAPAPRVNGRPDLSGVWQAERTPAAEYAKALGPQFTQLQIDYHDITRNFVSVFWGMAPGDGPLRPEAAAILKQRLTSGEEFPSAACLPASVPATMNVLAFKMIQTPNQIVVVFENGDPVRQIHTDGRTLPKDPNPSWMGYSVGHWQGDTLVVDTIGITPRAWLDVIGHPRSENMRITERYRRRDVGRMDFEVSLDDPKYYTRPFGYTATMTLLPDTDVLEYVCTENQKLRAR
jgi:hypothetical protein